MKREVAQLFVSASEKLEALENQLDRLLVSIDDVDEKDLEDEDVVSDLAYFRDAIQAAREGMEHRVADAQEELA